MTQKAFKLEQLFGSKTRARLMALFLQKPQEAFFVRELTRLIDAQLNSVRRELKNLIDFGMVEEKISESTPSTKIGEKKKYYQVNTHFILYEDLRALFQKVSILLKQNLVQEVESLGGVEYLAFTGRFVDAKDVSTDMLVVGAVDEVALNKMMQQFEQEYAYELNYTLMSKQEFLDRKQVSDRFLFSILHADKVVMVDHLLE